MRDDEKDIQDPINKGEVTPSIIEVIVYDTTGNVQGSDILGGCLVVEPLDVHDIVKDNDMLRLATADMIEKVTDIASIYQHLAKQTQK
jgi:hypothetical protein